MTKNIISLKALIFMKMKSLIDNSGNITFRKNEMKTKPAIKLIAFTAYAFFLMSCNGGNNPSESNKKADSLTQLNNQNTEGEGEGIDRNHEGMDTMNRGMEHGPRGRDTMHRGKHQ